jgi:hypothetical protein
MSPPLTARVALMVASDELRLIVLEAAMVEYHEALQPPETAWGHRGDFAEAALDELRARHELLVATGGLIGRLGWDWSAETDETVAIEAAPALLARVLDRAITSTLATDYLDLLEDHAFDAFVRVLRDLVLQVARVRTAHAIGTDGA